MSDITIVMFGSTGDLAKQKLWSAWQSLVEKDKIAKPRVLGVAYSDRTQTEFQELLHQASSDSWYASVKYLRGDLDKNQIYEDIALELASNFNHTVVFVLAVAPKYFSDIAIGIDESGLLQKCRDDGHKIRLLIEKPFGTDLESAKELDQHFCSRYQSDEIYRIDHYLGKSMVQNLYSLRTANQWFNAGLNLNNVKRIEVIFYEDNNASDRGDFYDDIGAWRDVGQNHMLQVLASGIATDLRVENANSSRTDILSSLTLANQSSWKRGQYKTYRSTPGVANNSNTETFFAIELRSNHPQWRDVPLLLQSGKATGTDEVRLTYYLQAGVNGDQETRLDFYSKPRELASIELLGQDDSHGNNLVTHNFEFSYSNPNTDAYERVFLSAINGDQNWFVSSDEIKAQWLIADKVHKHLADITLERYDNGHIEQIMS